MPYIDKEYRKEIDAFVDGLTTYHVKPAIKPVDNCGELNYAITRLCDNYIKSRCGLKYGAINEVVGVLECAKMEFYRRIAGPYEDTKIAANGDVHTCNIPTPKA